MVRCCVALAGTQKAACPDTPAWRIVAAQYRLSPSHREPPAPGSPVLQPFLQLPADAQAVMPFDYHAKGASPALWGVLVHVRVLVLGVSAGVPPPGAHGRLPVGPAARLGARVGPAVSGASAGRARGVATWRPSTSAVATPRRAGGAKQGPLFRPWAHHWAGAKLPPLYQLPAASLAYRLLLNGGSSKPALECFPPMETDSEW